MGFLTSLFGGGDNTVMTVVIALGVVLALIVFAVWALKMMFNASGNVARGRQKRLQVVEVSPVDQKRQLILIKRDDKEHLILVGGTQDLLIETGIDAPEVVVQRPLRAEKKQAKPAVKQPPVKRGSRNTRHDPRHLTSEPALGSTTNAEKTPSIRTPSPELPPMDTAPDPIRTFGASNESHQNANERKPSSLRHTGLLRPVSRLEPAVIPTRIENSDVKSRDSDKQDELTTVPDGASPQQERVENQSDENDGSSDTNKSSKVQE